MAETTDFRKSETRELVQRFARTASERGKALRAVDPNRANSLYKLMLKIYREIKRRGGEAQRQMLPLLENENAHIRVAVASLALEFDPQAAEPVLRKIGQDEHNFLGFTADMVLKQWKEGKLHSP
jgi:hypothetical protein